MCMEFCPIIGQKGWWGKSDTFYCSRRHGTSEGYFPAGLDPEGISADFSGWWIWRYILTICTFHEWRSAKRRMCHRRRLPHQGSSVKNIVFNIRRSGTLMQYLVYCCAAQKLQFNPLCFILSLKILNTSEFFCTFPTVVFRFTPVMISSRAILAPRLGSVGLNEGLVWTRP